MKSIITLFIFAGMGFSSALAQESPSPAATASASASASATEPSNNAPARHKKKNKEAAVTSSPTAGGEESTGTIVEFIPNESLVLNTGGKENMHFKLAKNVTYSNPRGKSVGAAKMKKDRHVQVRYTKDGSDMVVNQVTLVKEKKRGQH